MSASRRSRRRFVVLVVMLTAGAGAFARPASAHPLGNLSVNHYHGLQVEATRLVDDAVVDTAEIPTAQAQGLVDTNGDGTASADELTVYGARQCELLRAAVTVTDDGRPLTVTVASSSFAYRPGQAGLDTSRLECRLEAPLDISSTRTLVFADSYLADRVGWHEITAVGVGTTLVDPPVPSESVTGRLDHYPVDLLSSPMAVRKVTLQVAPGGAVPGASAIGSGTVATPAPPAQAKRHFSIEALGPFAGVVDRINRSFNDLVGHRQLTIGVGSLAIALALVLGASHAVLPGHGKTVMAAYIAGRQGSVRDAVLVGATVTATHTGGVLLLGFALTASTALAGEVVLGWLGVASGLLIAALGFGLLLGATRRKQMTWGGHRHGPDGHSHGPRTHDEHDHDAHEHDGHDHDGHAHDGHEHDGHEHDAHEHDREPSVNDGHLAIARAEAAVAARGSSGGGAVMVAPASQSAVSHVHATAGGTATSTPGPTPYVSRRGLVGMGVAGGLVPSPSALVVLLSAIALGRTAFGILLVVAYGFGMASTLTVAGIILVRVRDRYQRRSHERGRARALGQRWTRVAPFATATLVVVVGVGLAVRSLALL